MKFKIFIILILLLSMYAVSDDDPSTQDGIFYGNYDVEAEDAWTWHRVASTYGITESVKDVTVARYDNGDTKDDIFFLGTDHLVYVIKSNDTSNAYEMELIPYDPTTISYGDLNGDTKRNLLCCYNTELYFTESSTDYYQSDAELLYYDYNSGTEQLCKLDCLRLLGRTNPTYTSAVTATYDLDSDGKDDLITTLPDGVYYNITGTTNWRRLTPPIPPTTNKIIGIWMIDIVDDSDLEVFILESNGCLRYYLPDSDSWVLWTGSCKDFTCGEYDGNSYNEAINSDDNGVYRWWYTTSWQYSQVLENSVEAMSSGDFDGDGTTDLIVASQNYGN